MWEIISPKSIIKTQPNFYPKDGKNNVIKYQAMLLEALEVAQGPVLESI